MFCQKNALFMKQFHQDFPQLNLKENNKTMTSDCLYLYGTLCWSCRSRLSISLPLRTSTSGVLFLLFFKLMSAPLSHNSWATSLLLFRVFHTPDVWWRQFGWKVLQVEELSNHTYHSHPQAVHLSTTDQPLWGHHALLHKGSFNE